MIEYEKELKLKSVQCQEMEKSLDLETILKRDVRDKHTHTHTVYINIHVHVLLVHASIAYHFLLM